jgi:DNA invertase Pin-like site-specific DNA recombinase
MKNEKNAGRVMVSVERKQERGRRYRLTPEQVDEMVTRFNAGETQASLAAAFGVSVSTVQRYIRLRTPKE